jgi:hypothetical protein
LLNDELENTYLSPNYNYDDKVKKDQMSKAFSMNDNEKESIRDFGRKPDGNRLLRKPRRIILKRILDKQNGYICLFIWLRIETSGRLL